MATPLSIRVQADPARVEDWGMFARRIEHLGFEGLSVADHPGSGSAPFVALAAAAAVTERIDLTTYVANAGLWDPIALASSVATLDVVSGGRAVLGVGAGHTPAEWLGQGVDYPSPGARVDRMIEATDATRQLLAGDEVTLAGVHVTLQQARLDAPRPVQRPVPLLVGGSGRRVLAYAAEQADVVALAGLGRTLPDGHRHEVRWQPAQIDDTIEHVRTIARAGGRTPPMEALVQHVEITGEPEAAAARLCEQVPDLTVEDALAAPFVWIGTADEIASRLDAHRGRWGITRYVVRADAVDAATEVRERFVARR